MKAAGAPPKTLSNVASLTFLVAGIITLIFATKKLGGGYCLPTQASVPFFALSLTAAKIGGLGLVVGTALVSACMGLLLSPFIARFKGRSAMELSASILFIMGIWAAQLGVNELFHPGSLGLLMVHGHFFTYKTFNIGAAIPGFITLVLLLSLACWRHYRLHCVLYALVIGGVISWVMGAAPSLPQNISQQLPWFAVPHFFSYPPIQFSRTLLLPCVLVAIQASFEAFSITHIIDKLMQRRRSYKRQLKVQLVAALGTSLTALGGTVVSIIPGAIGDMLTGSAFSRSIAFFYTPMLILLAFMPKVSVATLHIPAAVNGAVLVFMGATMVFQGLKMLELPSMSLTNTKIYGVVCMLALCVLIVPSFVEFIQSNTPWLTNPAECYALLALFILLSLSKLRRIHHAK